MEIFRNLIVVFVIIILVVCNDVMIEGFWVELVFGIFNLK